MTRTDEDESPSQILKKINFTADNKDDDEDSDKDESVEQLSDEDEVGSNYMEEDSNQDEQEQLPVETLTMEEMRLAKRAEVEEEIRMAKEVKRHLMENISKERAEEKLAQLKREEERSLKSEEERSDEIQSEMNYTETETPVEINTGKIMAGVQISTLCRLLDCVEEELYEPDPPDPLVEPPIEDLEEQCAEDTKTLRQTVAGLVEDLKECENRLGNIEMMQSTILAETAALNGEDEFRIGSGGLKSINRERKVSPIFAKYYKSPTEQIPPQGQSISRLGSFSKRVALTMKSFRIAAAKLDSQRLHHNRREANQ